MFEKTFELAVVISAVDRMTGPLMRATKMMGVAQKQSAALEKQMKQAKAMMMVGGAMTGLGVAMGYGLLKAAESAGKLQTAVLGVSNAMKLTKAQSAELTNMSMTQGIQTAFSAVTTAQLYQAMSQAGFSNKMIFNKGLSDQMIKFADAQYMSSNQQQSPTDAVAQATGMAHLYQMYNPKQLGSFLNTLNAALTHTHTSIDQFATQFKYFAGTANHKGISAQQALMDQMFLMRMGVGGGGRSMGTSLNDFFLRMSGMASKAAATAMAQAGFIQNGHSVFTTANGNFVGIPAAIKQMEAFNRRFGGNSNVEDALLKTIFGVQGMRVADALMTKHNGAMNQYSMIQQQVANTASVSQIQRSYNKSFQGQMQQAKTTLEDLGQILGKQLLMPMTKTLVAVNKVLYRLLMWGKAHQQIVRVIGAVLSLATAFMVVVGPMMVLAGFLQYLRLIRAGLAALRLVAAATGGTFRILFAPARLAIMIMYRSTLVAIRIATLAWRAAQWLLNLAMDANPIMAVVTIIVGLLIVIAELIAHWKTVVNWLKQAWQWFTHLKLSVQLLLMLFVPFLAIPALIIRYWTPIKNFFEGLFHTVGGVLKGVEHFFGLGGGSAPKSNYASVSPGAARTGGNTTVHIHAGAIVVHGAGNGVQAGKNVYKGIVAQAKASSRSRGVRPATSFAP